MSDSVKIGVCGVHRTGKTTLVERLANELKGYTISLNISEQFEKYNLDPSGNISSCERIRIQKDILNMFNYNFQKEFLNNKNKYRYFITDRTPCDFASYFQMELGGIIAEDKIKEYKDNCILFMNRIKYDYVVIIHPAIDIVPAEYKGNIDIEYMSILDGIFIDILNSYSGFYKVIDIPISLIDINDRVNFVKQFIKADSR
jgi:GTPase SAR1 family protein